MARGLDKGKFKNIHYGQKYLDTWPLNPKLLPRSCVGCLYRSYSIHTLHSNSLFPHYFTVDLTTRACLTSATTQTLGSIKSFSFSIQPFNFSSPDMTPSSRRRGTETGSRRQIPDYLCKSASARDLYSDMQWGNICLRFIFYLSFLGTVVYSKAKVGPRVTDKVSNVLWLTWSKMPMIIRLHYTIFVNKITLSEGVLVKYNIRDITLKCKIGAFSECVSGLRFCPFCRKRLMVRILAWSVF